MNKLLDVSDLILCFSLIALFVFLTIQTIQKKTLELGGCIGEENKKKMFQSPQSRYGTYSMVITAVVIAIVIVINMIAGQLLTV